MDDNPYRAPNEEASQRAAAWRILLVWVLFAQGIFFAFTVAIVFRHLIRMGHAPGGLTLEDGLIWSSSIPVELAMIAATMLVYSRQRRQSMRDRR
jgi:hypothetical protein